ncbi:maleylpyruvate isomerase N-terminal domain-containing protein [Mycobacterium sp. UM_WGJ]|uniref:maleylpyruvate isomerase N-terminal domain-containing protein n=1 Tax=Mycobacterium sp. UM_WGJ TaxID=1370120 RepID=UPI00046441DA|nr:maleylpyruvate isomerase N-terminal domain-containing protein [Mycobacterium sp. UM_WGJ]
MTNRIDIVRAARHAFVDTVDGLTDAEFDHGTTLCAQWSPRDVLAHLIGTSEIGRYLRAPWRLHKINAEVVTAGRGRDRADLIAAARRWAQVPDRAVARLLLGDLAMHHQDVLRGLGRSREIPPVEEAAILTEGVSLTVQKLQPTLLRYRIEPTNGIGRPRGRGTVVRGTAEALGLWLGGRTISDVEIG